MGCVAVRLSAAATRVCEDTRGSRDGKSEVHVCVMWRQCDVAAVFDLKIVSLQNRVYK